MRNCLPGSQEQQGARETASARREANAERQSELRNYGTRVASASERLWESTIIARRHPLLCLPPGRPYRIGTRGDWRGQRLGNLVRN